MAATTTATRTPLLATLAPHSWAVPRRPPRSALWHITLPGDVNQVDETGFVWAFLDDGAEPVRVRPGGALIVSGDPTEPFLARVVDLIDGPNDTTIVHLDVVGVPDEAIDHELRHARLLPQ